METADNLKLSWNSHSNNFKTVLKELHQEESLSDVALVCNDGIETMAHKFVLVGSSPVFKSMLYQSSQRDKTIVYLRGVSKIELEWVLQFMYLGQTQVPPSKLQNFMDLAKDLKMKGMYDENDPDVSEEKANEKRNSHEDDNVLLDSEGKHKIQEELYKRDYKLAQEDANKNRNLCDRVTGKEQDIVDIANNTDRVALAVPHETLVTAKDYQNHSETNQLSQFICSECEYFTQHKQLLKNHIETKHKGVRYPCDVCNYQALSVMNLRDHQASKHKINPRFRCKLCGFCTNHTNKKKDHVPRQHPESIGQEIFEINKKRRENGSLPAEAFDPKIMMKSLYNENASEEIEAKEQINLYEEDNVLHDSTGDLIVYSPEEDHKIQEEVLCQEDSELAPEDAVKNTNLGIGDRGIPKEEDKANIVAFTVPCETFNCNECEYYTKSKQSLKRHIETDHKGVRYPCNVCNHQSRSVMNLRDHKATLHKINPRFRCKLCDFCTNHTRLKREHVTRRHPSCIGQEIFEINKRGLTPEAYDLKIKMEGKK